MCNVSFIANKSLSMTIQLQKEIPQNVFVIIKVSMTIEPRHCISRPQAASMSLGTSNIPPTPIFSVNQPPPLRKHVHFGGNKREWEMHRERVIVQYY